MLAEALRGAQLSTTRGAASVRFLQSRECRVNAERRTDDAARQVRRMKVRLDLMVRSVRYRFVSLVASLGLRKVSLSVVVLVIIVV